MSKRVEMGKERHSSMSTSDWGNKILEEPTNNCTKLEGGGGITYRWRSGFQGREMRFWDNKRVPTKQTRFDSNE